MIYNSAAELIGKTPIVRLKRIEEELKLKGKLFAKVEFFNPGGSVKDRAVLSMIEDYENKGLLKEGSTIIEPTSGNTGIGLAWVSSLKSYKVIIVMPDSMSVERIKLIKSYGAQVILTPGACGMAGSIKKAEELLETTENSIILGQFVNQANPLAHYQTTGPEIYSQMDKQVDVFVSSVGSGGTISGVGKFLKEQSKNIEIIAVEPTNSPMLSEGKKGPHKIQGIGAGFIPGALDVNIYDRVLTVTDDEAFDMARYLAVKEGLSVGISSGAALSAGIQLAKRLEYEDKNIVILLPDSGARYMSTNLFI